MTRAEALNIFNINLADFDKLDNKEAKVNNINSIFRNLVKNVHPDTARDNFGLSVAQIKEARDILIKFIDERDNIDIEPEDNDICPYCLGEGVIKVLKGFNIVNEKCTCTKIKKK